jgi:hypothetical protein
MDKKDLPASGISSRGIVIVQVTGGKSNRLQPWEMQKKMVSGRFFLVPYPVLLKITIIIYHHGDLMTAVKIP